MTMLGKTQGFSPARNPINGFYRHWIDMNTGARMWNSEYSSIDTAIMVSGALFAKQYFASSHPQISSLADQIFLSIDWSMSIKDPSTGEIFMTFEEDGSGSLPLKPFNEYMIVSWLAKHDSRKSTRAQQLWLNFYETPDRLPKILYDRYELLTDDNIWNKGYLSNFVIQFPYYLCHHFTTT